MHVMCCSSKTEIAFVVLSLFKETEFHSHFLQCLIADMAHVIKMAYLFDISD